MSNIAYIIPGFNEYPDNIGYKKISEIFKQFDIEPIVINIDWTQKNKTFYDFVEDLVKYYNTKKHNGNVYLLGFSAGAWIAFMASLIIKPTCTITCSLSPYFEEDMRFWKEQWINEIGKKQFEMFKNYKFKEIVSASNSKIIFLYGEKDINLVKERSKIAHNKIKNSKLILIPNAGHDIRQLEYLRAIQEVITAEINH